MPLWFAVTSVPLLTRPLCHHKLQILHPSVVLLILHSCTNFHIFAQLFSEHFPVEIIKISLS